MRAEYIYVGCVLGIYNRDIETGKIMWYVVTKFGESIEDCILYALQDEYEDNHDLGFECIRVKLIEVITNIHDRRCE